MHPIKKYGYAAVAICLFVYADVQAQLTVQNGAILSTSGNALVSLQDADLINNGTINQQAGNGKFVFTGTGNNNISGSSSPTFDVVEISKTGTAKILLLQKIYVTGSIDFTSGFIDLNGYDADLGTTGILNGEQENSRVIGATGGQLLFSTTLNAPSSANPANLGAVISSTQNLGATTVKRGQQIQVNNVGTGFSILRYYNILPANNAALNATLRLQYFDGELNGLDENALGVWEKTGVLDWAGLGFDVRNNSTNYVEKNAVNLFGRFTLGAVNGALPLHFVSFNTLCYDNSVLLTWKTAQEQNSLNFVVQRSADGNAWQDIGMLPAAGNSTMEKSYSFTDNMPAGNPYYRIVANDITGDKQLTNILHVTCNFQPELKVWPNPVTDVININLTVSKAVAVTIQLTDSKGAIVQQQSAQLLKGNNLLKIDFKSFPSGVYFATIIYSNGQFYSQRILKK